LSKIFFFSFLYPPLARSRTRQLISTSLAKEGYRVNVITTANPHGFFNKFLKDYSMPAEHANVNVIRINTFYWWALGEFLYLVKLFPDSQMNWVWSVRKQLKNIIASEKGVILAIYPPFADLLSAYQAKKNTGFPLILDYRDEFLDLTAPNNGFRRNKLLRIEKEIVNSADLISVATSEIKTKLQNRYSIPDEKFIICYSGYDDSGYIYETNIDTTELDVQNLNKLKIVYAGAMSQHQKPEVICQAYSLLSKKYPDIAAKISIKFYGPANYYFNNVLKKFLCNNIEYGGFIPLSNFEKIISQFDIGFFSLADDKYKYAIPRKLFDYIKMNLPVLAALPKGEAWKIIEENKIGKVVEYDNVSNLANAILDLFRNRNNLADYRKNLVKIKPEFGAMKQYQKLAQKLNELYNEQ